ncbi:MAG TPA: glycoside hydrolase family 31 protein [Opitutaceae bacterium]|nr:glycoside hydrolase family 31 protein [Opitutaceae bacterium]
MKYPVYAIACFAVSAILHAAPVIQRDARGVTVTNGAVVSRVEFWSDRIVHITHRPKEAKPAPSLSVIGVPQSVHWTYGQTDQKVTLSTPMLAAEVDLGSGVVRVVRDGGAVLTDERGPAEITPATVGGAATWRIRQSFQLADDEGIYGLGQHPDGQLDQRGLVVHLQQENRIVAVPVLVSSHGYGVLWDNPAVTDVDVGKRDPHAISWTSEAGDGADYYVIDGPNLDAVVGGYRALTGSAPLFPLWAWGLWQCRERYTTQAQLLGVLSEYRQRGIPLDGIIQDWQYWRPGGWGSHDFDPERYPDPTAMVQAVHRAHAHILISVWPRFDLGLEHTAELDKAHALYPPVYKNVYPAGQGRWYDPFSAAGRSLYWKFLSEKLFSRGFDGWWMDASEPELGGRWGQMRDVMTGAGPGAKVFNAYPLMHARGVYQGQRAATSAKRVVILTRSAFAGSQRNAAITWSGDTHGTWEVFRQQIPAGLNFSITGIPYWNTDIGGFFAGDPSDPKYAELFTRWFQFGAFCPMFRIHGTGKPKEIWRFGEKTQEILIKYDELRYHLLPYIYSVSWQVTHDGYTMLRPLVMDFRRDPGVRNVTNQFMFGPALMANPVTDPGVAARSIYLPAGARWIDFWTGEPHDGGVAISTAAPIDRMPLMVRAGSIIPYAPDRHYSTENPGAPLEIRIYPGANGEFTLYEDEGDNYDYEHGAYSTTTFTWDDATRTLTIGKRKGDFPGLQSDRVFRIVRVVPGHGVAVASTSQPDAEVTYHGTELAVTLGTQRNAEKLKR